MPITRESLTTRPYLLPGGGMLQPVGHNGAHYIFSVAGCRVAPTVAVTPDPKGVYGVQTGMSTPAGDTIFLPYRQDSICSIRLPVPPPNGVTTFMTASLSGCRFIIDRVESDNGQNSDDLIAYHANVMPPAGGGALVVNHQTLGVTVGLTNLWILAQHDYEHPTVPLVAAIPHRLRLAIGASLIKPRYNRSAGLLVQRKIGMSRFNVEFEGGVSVVGFVENGGWAFYFQTWGDLTYNRPWYAGLHHLGWHKTKVTARVIECAQFYPARLRN